MATLKSEAERSAKLNGAATITEITPEEAGALDEGEALMSQLRVNLFTAAGLAASAIPLGVTKAHKPHPSQ
jgi:hypothetical protein